MSQNAKITREEYQVKLALDSLRKKNTPEVEAEEEDKDKETVNPHVPKYIVQAPWYLNQKEQNLDHQKSQGPIKKTDMSVWYTRGTKAEAAIKYRKGACENCGAMTHKTKDCLDRPRKTGAKWSGKDIMPDEHVNSFSMTWEAKRDRWNGYDPEMYSEVIREHEEFEEARKQIRKEELAQGKTPALDDEFKEHMFDNNAPVAQSDPRTKTTIRDLRIREDIANYLLDLSDVNSKGPKNQVKEGENTFMSEAAMRLSGDAGKLIEQEKMVWDFIQNENADINSVALPTATEMIYRKIKEKQQEQIDARKNELTQKYGQNQSIEADPNVIFSQTERYVEYTRDGKIKTETRKKVYGKSKYEEDIYPGDHTSIWGSYWSEEFGWGYHCCYQTVKASTCLGEKGRKIALAREYKAKKMREEQLKGYTSQIEEADHEKPEEKKPEVKAESKPEPSFQAPQSKPTPGVVKPPTMAPPENAERKVTAPVEKEKPTKKAVSSSSSSSSSSSEDSSSSSDSDSSSSGSSGKSRSRSKEKDRRKPKEAQSKLRTKDKKEEIDPKKLQKAIAREKERMRERSKEKKGKESKYNSSKTDYEVSAEDMEAYRMTKKKFEDPMNKYL